MAASPGTQHFRSQLLFIFSLLPQHLPGKKVDKEETLPNKVCDPEGLYPKVQYSKRQCPLRPGGVDSCGSSRGCPQLPLVMRDHGLKHRRNLHLFQKNKQKTASRALVSPQCPKEGMVKSLNFKKFSNEFVHLGKYTMVYISYCFPLPTSGYDFTHLILNSRRSYLLHCFKLKLCCIEDEITIFSIFKQYTELLSQTLK